MQTKLDFIGGNTKRCLMAMALPMIAAMFLNMMYNLVDSLWIGNLLGETAYATLTNSTPIILILTSVAMGGNEWNFHSAISGNRSKGQGENGKPDRNIVLCDSCIFAACNGSAGSIPSGNFEGAEYPG